MKLFKMEFTKTYRLMFTPFYCFLQQAAIQCVLLPVCRMFFKIEILGKENMPPITDKVILAPNHRSNFDPLLIAGAVTFFRPTTFLAKKELFQIPLLNYIIYFLGSIEVDREKLKVSTIKSAKNLLKSERWLCIFPEGTRNKTKNPLGEVQVGFATLAKATDSYILPVSIKNSNKRFSKVTIKIGLPFKVDTVEIAVEKWKEDILSLLGDHDE